jgi:sialidase-1
VLALAFVVLQGLGVPQADPVVLRTGFDEVEAGPVGSRDLGGAVLSAAPGEAVIHAAHHRSPPHALRILGGTGRRATLEFADRPIAVDELTFRAERWTARPPFTFRIEVRGAGGWAEVWNGDEAVTVGTFAGPLRVPLAAAGPLRALRFVATSPDGSGVLIDDLLLLRPEPMRILGARQRIPAVPVLAGGADTPLLEIEVEARGSAPARSVRGLAVRLDDPDLGAQLTDLRLEAEGLVDPGRPRRAGDELLFEDRIALHHGTNRIRLLGRAAEAADLDRCLAVRCVSIRVDEGPALVPDLDETGAAAQRFGRALRSAGEGGVHTSRIPALVATPGGTLIAAFDLRHRGAGDLPGDIDVGVRRSTDGGRTWSATATAVDLGAPEAENGVGDPCLLVDARTGRVWLFALWCRGDTGWNGSRPGLEPGVTGQLLACWSDDEGATWSAPRNLTAALKDPSWRLFLQGPGSGITTADGTLVAPAQFRDAAGLPHATVIWSADRGATWQVGRGARPDTTESAVVELADGGWMLNMRDNRGGSRAVAVSADRGLTWTEHPSSRRALPEPVCMASLIRFPAGASGPAGDLLLFSNPAVPAGPRRRITVRHSRDEGATWSAGLLLDEGRGAGYSSLCRIDAETLGILYEGSGAQLVFQRLPLAAILAAD